MTAKARTDELEGLETQRRSLAPGGEVHEDLAALAVQRGPESIGPLKGIARFLRDQGAIRPACLIYTLASERIFDAEGPEAASRELGAAAALARRHGDVELAEALFRESVDRDPENLRSRSGLGQLLHHRGAYDEAAEWLEPAAEVDNHARLFYGWSLLLAGLERGDATQQTEGEELVAEALRRWAYGNRDAADRPRWLRQLQRLGGLGDDYEGAVLDLVDFANTQASGWHPIDDDEAFGPEDEPVVPGVGPDDTPDDTRDETPDDDGTRGDA